MTPPASLSTRPRIAPTGFALVLAVFAVLLSSFPARNLDVWQHLTSGRDLFRSGGGFGATWLYDIATYAVYSAVGGGLVGVKALLCGGLAVLLFRLTASDGWRVTVVTTGLAVLALSHRMMLQPQTASVLLLAVGLWLVYRRKVPAGFLPWWPEVALLVAWANTDHWVVLGLVVVAVARLGQRLDDRAGSPLGRALGRWAVVTAVLAGAACVSPSHVHGLAVPPELRTAFDALSKPTDSAAPRSPFAAAYLEQFQGNSAALAYYPLLGLSGLSFLLNRQGWKWGRALPWAVLAAVSAVEARAVPFFALLAGPVAAWNLQPFFARRPAAPKRWVRVVGWGLSGVVAAAFLVAAWPGWLQAPPFEPRRWAVDMPPALDRGADLLRRTHAAGLWAEGTGTLHVSPDTAAAFAWLAPDDPRRRDDEPFRRLLDRQRQEEAREWLRANRVSRVVVWAADTSKLSHQALDRLLADPDEWRPLHVWGGLVVFAWADPAAPTPAGYATWEVNFDRLGFRPNESEAVPANGPPTPPEFWEVFWKPAFPPSPPGRFEADVLFRRAEAARPIVPYQNVRDWEAGQVAGLVGAAAAGGQWPAVGVDSAVRLAMIQPPAANAATATPLSQLATVQQQRLAATRGALPLAELYASVRAARRGVGENPTDARAYLALAQGYLNLIENTSEKRWAERDGIPQLRRVREIQAVAALNKAISYNRRLALAHLGLSQLYRKNGCLDLAAEHLQEFRQQSSTSGGAPADKELLRAVDTELTDLKKDVATRKVEYEKQTTRSSVSERALTAMQLQLGGMARDLLLKSDVSAFGAQGVELEVDLLLRTGRPHDVLLWTTPEVGGSLGEQKYRWMLAQAHLAVGDYESADRELAAMAGADGGGRSPTAVVEEVAAVVGKSVLDCVPRTGQWDQHFFQTLSLADLQKRLIDITGTVSREANMTTLRGLMALEVGNVPRARAAFADALSLTPDRWGGGNQLEFGGRRTAVAGLDLTAEPPGR